MRTTNTSVSLALFMFAVLSMSASEGMGKTDKYKRPSSGGSDTSAADSPDKSESPSKTGVSPATPPNPDKKVDISDLENRYWTAKDTEFNVVQNRLYTKAKRFSLTGQLGTNLSDQYTSNYNFGLALNYYFSERHGVELTYWRTSATDADFVTSFGNQFGVIPDHNMPQGFLGVGYNYVPIYAKLSLLEKKILYFDMAISPGIGVTFLKADVFSSPTLGTPPANTSAPLTFALDVTQQVFLDEHWALRLDLRNHIYGETIYSAGATNGGAVARTKTTYSGVIMFGVTYFH